MDSEKQSAAAGAKKKNKKKKIWKKLVTVLVVLLLIGGVIYALKLPVFDRLPKNFGNHEIFHLFVMAGSLCHYIVIYSYVLA